MDRISAKELLNKIMDGVNDRVKVAIRYNVNDSYLVTSEYIFSDSFSEFETRAIEINVFDVMVNQIISRINDLDLQGCNAIEFIGLNIRRSFYYKYAQFYICCCVDIRLYNITNSGLLMECLDEKN